MAKKQHIGISLAARGCSLQYSLFMMPPSQGWPPHCGAVIRGRPAVLQRCLRYTIPSIATSRNTVHKLSDCRFIHLGSGWSPCWHQLIQLGRARSSPIVLFPESQLFEQSLHSDQSPNLQSTGQPWALHTISCKNSSMITGVSL